MLYKVSKINENSFYLIFFQKNFLGGCDSRRVAQECYKRRIKPPEHLQFFFNQTSIIPSSVTTFIKVNKNQWQFIKKKKIFGKNVGQITGICSSRDESKIFK